MRHCKGCSHPTICNTHGCAADEYRRNQAQKGDLQDQRDELLKARRVLGAENIALKHENARLRLLIQRIAKYPDAAASPISLLRADVLREAGPAEDWRA